MWFISLVNIELFERALDGFFDGVGGFDDVVDCLKGLVDIDF